MQNSNQWSENYQQILDDLTLFDAPPSPARATLGPQASIAKPMRRRQKTKAPTTHLTTDANNFRALVQHFTGCKTAATPFGPYRGPINLNFENCSYYPKNMERKEEKGVDCNLHEESEERFLTFVSGVDESQNARSDALTNYNCCDDHEMDNFWLQGLLGTVNDEFWGD